MEHDVPAEGDDKLADSDRAYQEFRARVGRRALLLTEAVLITILGGFLVAWVVADRGAAADWALRLRWVYVGIWGFVGLVGARWVSSRYSALLRTELSLWACFVSSLSAFAAASLGQARGSAMWAIATATFGLAAKALSIRGPNHVRTVVRRAPMRLLAAFVIATLGLFVVARVGAEFGKSLFAESTTDRNPARSKSPESNKLSPSTPGSSSPIRETTPTPGRAPPAKTVTDDPSYTG